MAVFRFLAAVFLLVATVALVVDASPPIYGAGAFEPTALGTHWKDMGATSFEVAKSAVMGVAPWLWEGLIGPILAIPTFVTFGILAIVSGYAGRRRRTVNVFVN
jgi:hypothetical protein